MIMRALILKALLGILWDFDTDLGSVLGFRSNSHWEGDLLLVLGVHKVLLGWFWLLLQILKIILHLILIIL